MCRGDRGDDRAAGIDHGPGAGVRGRPTPEARIVGVLGGDEGGIVEAHHGSTIGRPGTPRGAGPPPSQTLTVAPTSANSPSSCTLPAAFRPST